VTTPSFDEVRLFLWDHIDHEGGPGITEEEGHHTWLICAACDESVSLGPCPVSTGERKKGHR
jgi:hypothetical protein